MSNDTDEFLSETDGQQTGGGLRAKLEQALARLKELETENTALKSKETEREVGKIWDELKVPAPIRGFYSGDKSEKAIKEWWTASQGFFNTEVAETTASEPQESEQDRATRESYQQFQQASSTGTDRPAGLGNFQAEAEQIKGLTGTDQKAALKAFYEKHGIPAY